MKSITFLNAGNAKTIKGEKVGFRTYGIHLAPSTKSGAGNVCPWSDGCEVPCLDTAGRGIMANVQAVRIEKTRFFLKQRTIALHAIHTEIGKAIRSAERAGLTPCFRLNLTSDIRWERQRLSIDGHGPYSLMSWYPEVQFYDYTKSLDRVRAYQIVRDAAMGDKQYCSFPRNYHLTFSRGASTSNQQVLALLKAGINVAAVFRNHLPEQWLKRDVIDGDVNDLRFLDPQGVIVGLVDKGKAKHDTSGFVIEH